MLFHGCWWRSVIKTLNQTPGFSGLGVEKSTFPSQHEQRKIKAKGSWPGKGKEKGKRKVKLCQKPKKKSSNAQAKNRTCCPQETLQMLQLSYRNRRHRPPDRSPILSPLNPLSEKLLDLGTFTWRAPTYERSGFLHVVSRDFEVGKSWSYVWLNAGLTTKVWVSHDDFYFWGESPD